jgi:hypothetical protein
MNPGISEAELENCLEGDVVGRYAGLLNIIDPENWIAVI